MILISYPHFSCYNNSHIDTHNYSHTHHTLKPVSLNSTKHSAYETLCAQHLNIKQHITTKCALTCFLQLPLHTAIISLKKTPIDLFLRCKLNRHKAFK